MIRKNISEKIEDVWVPIAKTSFFIYIDCPCIGNSFDAKLCSNIILSLVLCFDLLH